MMIRAMTRREEALHGLQAEFMQDAPVGEWVELPGGEAEGMRIPDVETKGMTMKGCWFERQRSDESPPDRV